MSCTGKNMTVFIAQKCCVSHHGSTMWFWLGLAHTNTYGQRQQGLHAKPIRYWQQIILLMKAVLTHLPKHSRQYCTLLEAKKSCPRNYTWSAAETNTPFSLWWQEEMNCSERIWKMRSHQKSILSVSNILTLLPCLDFTSFFFFNS